MKQARQQATLFHGGDLSSASEKFGQPKSGWIDLSTGINPMAYPSEGIPHSAFRDLPYLDADFVRAVESYYGKHSFIPLSGSQQLIQSLPSRLASLPVILPSLGYQEHHRAWANTGQACRYYSALNEADAIEEIDTLLSENAAQHLVIINPNNPTGQRFSAQGHKNSPKALC